MLNVSLKGKCPSNIIELFVQGDPAGMQGFNLN